MVGDALVLGMEKDTSGEATFRRDLAITEGERETSDGTHLCGGERGQSAITLTAMMY